MMKLLQLLPRFLRVKLIRNNITILPPPADFTVGIATTQPELERAYTLLHDCYVKTNLMAPDESGLRCNFFTFLPSTTTVIAKMGEEVVGTLSLIKDSSAGLPSDKDFREENDLLRSDNHKLVEVSSLAIDPKYRKKSHTVSLFLMKYLQHYCTHFMGCTTVTCVVHPRAQDFYAVFWGFKANKKIIKYKFVNDALGLHVYGNVTDEVLKKLSHLFPAEENRNPINFLFKIETFLSFPKRKIQSHLDPIFTPALLKYFMSEKTKVVHLLSRSQLLTIYSAYRIYFDQLESIEFFKELKTSISDRAFRFPCQIEAKLMNVKGRVFSGYIVDLTADGAFIATHENLDIQSDYSIEFIIDDQKFLVTARIIWKNRRIRGHQPIGYGIVFSVAQLGISRIFRETHMSLIKKMA